MDHPSNESLQLQLELTEEALRKAEERATAGRLALEVMHDIRNPLEAMRNLNYLTSVAANHPEDVRRYTQMAEEQLGIAIEIANNTLGFAKAPVRPKPINLAMLAEAGLRMHQPTIDRKRIHLVKQLAADAVAPIYPGEMLQVISNLITNALDALPPEGVLYLRTRKRKGFVHFLVGDNGHGIPANQVTEIFKPFFTTKDERGTGLGLALAKKIVERHQGTIHLRSSVRPGRSGTLFTVALPL